MKQLILLVLFTGVYIYILKSKRIPSILKNNVTSFVVQTVVSVYGILISLSKYGEIYEMTNTSSIIIYNVPNINNQLLVRLTKETYIYEFIVRIICIILYIVFGMLLIKQKSKFKDFLSVFISYIVLIIINQKISTLYFENIYVWVPYIFISKSSHIALQKATPLVYNSVFFILLFVPTLLMWVGLELKILYNNRNKNIEE